MALLDDLVEPGDFKLIERLFLIGLDRLFCLHTPGQAIPFWPMPSGMGVPASERPQCQLVAIEPRARLGYIPMRADDSRGGVHSGTNVLTAQEATYRGLVNQLVPNARSQSGGLIPTQVPASSEEAIRHLQRTLEQAVLAFIKPYNSILNDDHEDYYYAEREWRKFGNMKFDPKDVVGVVVHHEFLERAKEALPAFVGKTWTRKP